MNNKNKKSHKKHGMTLVEVIISIAVMAVLALLLTTIGVTIDRYRQDTKARNQQIAIESPIAESQRTGADSMAELIKDNYNIRVTADGSVINVTGELYSTSDEHDDDGNIKTRGHFKFVYIKP